MAGQYPGADFGPGGSFFQPTAAPMQYTPPMLPFGNDPLIGTVRGDVPASAQMAGPSTLGGPLVQAILQSMTGQTMMPNSYDHYSYTQNMMYQMQAAQGLEWSKEQDMKHMRAQGVKLASMAHNLPGSFDPVAVGNAYAKPAVEAMYNRNVQMLMSAMPQLSNFVEGVAGAPISAMWSGVYQGTRGMDPMNVKGVNAITGVLQDRMYAGGSYNPEFAHGLNRRQMGNLTGELMQRNIVARPGNANDLNGMASQVSDYAGVVASLGDVFGRDKSVTGLLDKLQNMTGGGMEQVSVTELQNMLSRVKVVAQKAGISLETMGVLTQTGAQYARQMGLGGFAGTKMAISGAESFNAVLDARQSGAHWGQYTQGELLNSVSKNRWAAASSMEGIATQGILRLAAEDTGNGQLQALAGRIRSGALTDADQALVADPSQLAVSLAGMGVRGGDAANVRSALSNRWANAQYMDESMPGAMSGQRASRLRNMTNVARSVTGDTASAKSMVAALMGADNDRGARKAAVVKSLTDKGMSQEEAEAKFAEFGDVYQNLYKGADINNEVDQISDETMLAKKTQAALLDNEQKFMESLESAGLGRSGSFMTRIMRGIMGGGSGGIWKTLGYAMGTPTAGVDQVIGQLSTTASGQKDVRERIENVNAEVQSAKAELDAAKSPKQRAAAQAKLSAAHGKLMSMFGPGGDLRPLLEQREKREMWKSAGVIRGAGENLDSESAQEMLNESGEIAGQFTHTSGKNAGEFDEKKARAVAALHGLDSDSFVGKARAFVGHNRMIKDYDVSELDDAERAGLGATFGYANELAQMMKPVSAKTDKPTAISRREKRTMHIETMTVTNLNNNGKDGGTKPTPPTDGRAAPPSQLGDFDG